MRCGLITAFCLSFRDVEKLLTERGIIVSYETIRQWCEKFGLDYARRLKTTGIWMKSSFGSTANGGICGVPWIRTAT
jgi:hypothetical protein